MEMMDLSHVLLSFLCGGSLLSLLTWRFARMKARAEAKQAEAEAKGSEVDMAQKVQDTYQQMLCDKQKEVEDNHRLIDELRRDRDSYKKDRDELRGEVENLMKRFGDYKLANERDILEMKRDIARNGRMVECMRPFMCGLAKECAKFVPVTISAEGAVKGKSSGKLKDISSHDE